MIENFIEWYTNGSSIINPYVADYLTDLQFLGAFATIGVLAVLFKWGAGAVNEKNGLTAEYIAKVVLLFLFATILKYSLLGYAYVIKQVDKNTKITLAQQNAMNDHMVNRYTNDLQVQYDSIANDPNASKSSQAYAWAKKMWLQYQSAGKLSSSQSLEGSSPFDFTNIIPNILKEIASVMRAALKLFYAAMMNIYYLIIPVSLIFSVFKPEHIMVPLGKYLIYGLVIVILNFIEWIMYSLFFASSVSGGTLIDISFLGATLYDALSVFLYLKAFSITRDIIPSKIQDSVGPMAAQVFGMAVLAASQLTGAGAAAKGASKVAGAIKPGGGGGGPVDNTLK